MADDKKRDYPRVEFRVQNKRMKKLLNERVGRFDTSTNTVARRDLRRYNTLLDTARPAFTQNQAMLLVDVFNDTLFEPIDMSLTTLWASLEDAADTYFEKHNVEKEAFVKHVRGLNEAEVLATIDAVERYRNGTGEGITVADVGLCKS